MKKSNIKFLVFLRSKRGTKEYFVVLRKKEVKGTSSFTRQLVMYGPESGVSLGYVLTHAKDLAETIFLAQQQISANRINMGKKPDYEIHVEAY